MDLKVMPRSYEGHKYILCIIDDVTNCLITVPIHLAKSEEVGDALIENNKFDIKIKTVAPQNHQSLHAEHGIKSLSNILTKHLTFLGQMWLKYLQ